jgi:hypothetical protein
MLRRTGTETIKYTEISGGQGFTRRYRVIF